MNRFNWPRGGRESGRERSADWGRKIKIEPGGLVGGGATAGVVEQRSYRGDIGEMKS